MLKPLGNYVLIKPDPIEEQTDWGFITAVSEKEKNLNKRAQILGTLVAVGLNAWYDSPNGPWAKVGDRVSYSKYGGDFIVDPDTGEELIIVTDIDVLCGVANDE